MKFFAIAALTVASLVVSESINDLPACSVECVTKAITGNTKCAVDDLTCVCQVFDTVQSTAASCIIEKCGAEVALNEVLPATKKLCAGDSSSSSSEAPKTTVSGSHTVIPPPHTTVTKSPSTVTLPCSTDLPPAPTVTGAAGAFAPMGGLVMVALGALAL